MRSNASQVAFHSRDCNSLTTTPVNPTQEVPLFVLNPQFGCKIMMCSLSFSFIAGFLGTQVHCAKCKEKKNVFECKLVFMFGTYSVKKKKICIQHLLARRSTNGNVIVHYKLVWRSEQKRKRVIVLMTWSSLGLPPPFTHWVVNQLILIVLYSLHPRW